MSSVAYNKSSTRKRFGGERSKWNFFIKMGLRDYGPQTTGQTINYQRLNNPQPSTGQPEAKVTFTGKFFNISRIS